MDVPEARKLLDSMDGGYGGMDCEDDSCGLLHDKCGGGFNTSTPCCDPELSCVVKNWYYAQCLSEEHAGELLVVAILNQPSTFPALVHEAHRLAILLLFCASTLGTEVGVCLAICILHQLLQSN